MAIGPTLALLALIAACGGVAVVGVRKVRGRRRLLRTGVHVRSVIVGVRQLTVPDTIRFAPIVRYQLHGRVWDSEPRGGQHVLKTGRIVNTHRSGEACVGRPMDVWVDPENPHVSAVGGTDRLGVLLIVVGTAFGLLLLLIALIAFAAIAAQS